MARKDLAVTVVWNDPRAPLGGTTVHSGCREVIVHERHRNLIITRSTGQGQIVYAAGVWLRYEIAEEP